LPRFCWGHAVGAPRFRGRGSLTYATHASGARAEWRPAGNFHAIYCAGLVFPDSCDRVVDGAGLGASRLRPPRRRLFQLSGAQRRSQRLLAALRARGALPCLGLQLSDRRRRRDLLAQIAGARARRGAGQRIRCARRGRDRAAARTGRVRDRSRRRRLQELRSSGLSCKADCEADNHCRAWTYLRPGYAGAAARCYLKDKVKPPRHKPCCVSGVVR